MKKFSLSLIATLAPFVIPLLLSAQTDSSRYDIGHLSLNKHFTQAVTIRGEDLEKMPFINLSEALGAWLLGAYTGTGVLVYVVDGNPVTDVDLYPIYDIAEVTYLPNAVAGAAYGNGLQELVLITTRQWAAKNGIRLVAQTGLIKAGRFQGPSHSGYYHQYYFGASHRGGKLSYGLSADWQQDQIASLQTTSTSEYVPPRLQRWRVNGRMEWRPDAQQVIRLTVGYAPQGVGYSLNSPGGGFQFHYSDWWYNHLLVPALSWEGHWSRGLRNKFDAEYLHGWSRQRYDETDTVDNNGSIVLASGYTQTTDKNVHLVLRDRLSLEVRAGRWRIVPALDISYQHLDERTEYIEFNPYVTTTTPNYVASGQMKGSLFYITPSADLSLGRALDIATGAMVDVSGTAGWGNRRLFPFVTAGVDLMHLGKQTGGGSLKLFGSYARRPLVYINDYRLGDMGSFYGNYGNYSLYQLYYSTHGYSFSNGMPNNSLLPIGDEPGYWAWVTGAAFRTADERVSLQYSFERRNYSFLLPSGPNSNLVFMPWLENLHHADVRVRIIDSKKASWMMGINATVMHGDGDTTGYMLYGVNLSSAYGDLNTAGNSWTGGWVNRLRFGGFSAGVDLLYRLGESTPVYGIGGAQIGVSRKNSVMLSNFYAGYRWDFGARMLELFVDARGLLSNHDNDLPDLRRFYSIGGSFSL